MSSSKALFNGFMVMIYCLIIGVVLNMSLAHGLDVMLVKFDALGMFDVPAAWDSAGKVTRLVNLFYFFEYAIPVIGIAYFFVSATRKQQYDKYKEIEYEQ